MSDWVAIPLSELAEVRISNVDKKVRLGETPVQLCNYMDVYTNDYINSNIEFMQSTANSIEKEKFKVCSGNVIITKDSETPFDIGIPAVVMEDIRDLVCGYHLALIKPNIDKVEPVYLSKQLASNAAARYFSKMAAGSTRYGLSNGAIAATAIPIAPLEQQRKIAAILFTIDQAIEKTEALIHKYQRIKAGLMHDLFTRGLTADGKLRPHREQAPELYQETPIGWIPKKWDYSYLRDKAFPNIQHLRTGPFGSALKGEHWVEDGHPVITIGSLGEGEFINSKLLYIGDFDAKRLSVFSLKLGDVVFSRVADVGRSVVIKEDQVGWIMSSNLMRISLNRNQVIPDFLQYQLSSDSRIKVQIRRKVNSGGRDIANSDILNRLIFSWPKFGEQNAIVEIGNNADAKLKIEQNKKIKLQKLKSGLMHDLLTGKVPVTRDPVETTHV